MKQFYGTVKNKRITIKKVLSLKLCPEYDKDLLEKLFDGKKSLRLSEILKLKIDPADLIWLFTRDNILPNQIRSFIACDCVEHTLKHFNKIHPKDKRPKKAIEICRQFLLGKATIEQVKKAGAYPNAVTYAALAAHSAHADLADYKKERKWQVKQISKYISKEQKAVPK